MSGFGNHLFMATCNPTKLLPLTTQTSLTLTLILTLTLNSKTKITLERGTNPNICAHILDTH